jgi:hypothetical protein
VTVRHTRVSNESAVDVVPRCFALRAFGSHRLCVSLRVARGAERAAAQHKRLRVCTFSFNTPHEVEAFRSGFRGGLRGARLKPAAVDRADASTCGSWRGATPRNGSSVALEDVSGGSEL